MSGKWVEAASNEHGKRRVCWRGELKKLEEMKKEVLLSPHQVPDMDADNTQAAAAREAAHVAQRSWTALNCKVRESVAI